MATDTRYRINGVVDTANTVLENIEQLALSSGSWVTFDVHTGKWSVIINQPGSPVKSFDDSNIIGGVELSSTGLTELYNSVKVTYPRGDINGATDTVEARIADDQRYNNEPDNVLEIVLPLVTDPVQALLIGSRELKQGRVDRVVKFTTDYTALDLNAGDLVAITLSNMGWTNKVFRVITAREADAEPGEIAIEVTALEYSADVYVNDLIKLDRSVRNELVSIGDIGTPAAPVINIIDADTRPRLELVATTPPGLVAGIEFWLSRTSTTADFVLVGTERPAAGGVYEAGTSVSLDVDNVNAGNVFARVRAVNSKTSSPYSPTSSGTFTPVQITSAVDGNTAIRGPGGLPLTTRGLTNLLSGVDQAYLGNTAPGSLNRIVGNTLSSDETFTDQIGNSLAANGLVGYTDIVTNIGNSIVTAGNVTIRFADTVSNVSGDSDTYWSTAGGTVASYVDAGPATVLFVDAPSLVIGSGPWPSGSTPANTAARGAVTTGYSYIFSETSFQFNGSYDLAEIDPELRATVNMYIDGVMVATGTSNLNNAPFLAKEFRIQVSAATADPNLPIYLEYTVKSSLSSSAVVQSQIYQVKGFTVFDNYTLLTPE